MPITLAFTETNETLNLFGDASDQNLHGKLQLLICNSFEFQLLLSSCKGVTMSMVKGIFKSGYIFTLYTVPNRN